jgi:hypothetical protein
MSRFMASKGLLHADEVAARSRTEERRVAGRMAAMWMWECLLGLLSLAWMYENFQGDVDEWDEGFV